MKKYMLFLLIVVLVLTGCGKKDNEKTKNPKSYLDEPLVETVCSALDYRLDYNYKRDAVVVLHSRGGAVLTEKDSETTISSNPNMINKYIERTRAEYLRQNERYGGTTFSINSNDDEVNVEATIDFSKYNMKNFMDDYGLTEDNMIDGYVNLDTLVYLYEFLGFECYW